MCHYVLLYINYNYYIKHTHVIVSVPPVLSARAQWCGSSGGSSKPRCSARPWLAGVCRYDTLETETESLRDGYSTQRNLKRRRNHYYVENIRFMFSFIIVYNGYIILLHLCSILSKACYFVGNLHEAVVSSTAE